MMFEPLLIVDLLLTTPYLTCTQHDSLDPYVELLGKVERDCTITIQRIVNFGTDFGKAAVILLECPTFLTRPLFFFFFLQILKRTMELCA